ncbi:hypothetical protein Cni_G14186 [Canna indica]|uniref:Pentatricopeptide repeat-containing protein n=1 Tax=Canna indica TaxID=4628 RepID=A0AAQ3KBQ3_9LILI|nr:hypothetical protein Cni_G14186 [Canna indica]
MSSCRRFLPSAVHPRDLPLLQCLSLGDLGAARRFLDDSSHHPGAVVRWTAALSQFAHAGFLREAVALFDLMPSRNLVTWNALLSAYLHAGRTSDALDIFSRMPDHNVVSYTSALCALARAGRIDEARVVFNSMPERNVVSYNAMLAALVRSGDLSGARRMFDEMPERTAASGNVLLAGYAERGRMAEARCLFDEMVRSDSANVVSWTTMIAGYARAGDVWEAYYLFRTMIPSRNVVSWTAMIGGLAWNGFYDDAVSLFLEMKRAENDVKPNGETLLSLLYACAGLGFAGMGKQAHAYVLVHGLDSGGEDGRLTKGLIHMYSRFGYMDWARRMLDSGLSTSDAICWNSMIEGYIRIGRLGEARRLFDEITVDPQGLSWITMIVTWTTMITAYFDAGDVAEARRLFERMPERDATAWTAVISGLVRNERVADAFTVLAESRAAGFAPVGHSIATLLGAVGSVTRLELGEQLHGLLVKTRPAADTVLGNALVSMYSKSGDMENALKVFHEEAPSLAAGGGGTRRDVVTWNAMVVGLAHHGRAEEALRLFEAMRREAEPNGVTCLGALAACDHAGMLDRAEEVIRFMAERQIPIGPEHVACVVDMLGRAGRFVSAERLAKAATDEPELAVWGALLGTCGMARGGGGGGDEVKAVGERAARRVFGLDPSNAAAHVALCHVYAWNGVEEGTVRRNMERKGVRKRPGCSWVALRGTVDVFFCGDRSHPWTDEIYLMLHQITCAIRNTADE